ncbi:isoprenoid synthase domain-containing protein [Suillus subaureus]|uniref:Isoprenoid synthase domain-containing protein n=1 Tax=Suillus subaureus TaxID=48587 RepID=A0A9P7E4I2_9AGAM|nr:isoprenoid synthase domain-containing protein [Suillus subaureus]KAG1810973.1 isoprenoid synthase domain-containing protein [Suillus subaureus]
MQSNSLITPIFNNGQVLVSIRQATTDFLRRCGLPHANIANIAIDKVLYSECYQEAINRGFPMDGKYSLRPYMDIGVAVSHIYAHLPDRATRMWICLFTILLICIDDMMDKGDDLVNMYSFYERFVNKQSQGDPVLNVLDALLRDVVCYYSSPVSNLIVTSTFDFISSILLDNETKDMQILTETPSYPDYLGMLSGMPAAYSLFIFPSTLPLQEYVQCMPDLAIIINHTNDILSYYKEEIEGDTMNYVSRVAVSRGLTKQDALQETIEKTVQAHHNILKCLRLHAETCNAYVRFFYGFAIKFHAALRRYKLEEITSESSH